MATRKFLTGSCAVQSLLGDGGIAKQVVLKRAPSGHLNSFFLSQILLSQFVLKPWKSALGDRLLHPNPQKFNNDEFEPHIPQVVKLTNMEGWKQFL